MSGRILVVGNASLNVVLDVESVPVDGETVVAAGRRHDIGGKGANQAVAAARAGAPVAFVSRLGDDSEGERILAHLRGEGLDMSGVVVDAAPTNCSYVLVDGRGHNRIVSVHAPAAGLRAPALDALAAMRRGDLVLLQGNVEEPVAAAVLAAARGSGVRTVLNGASLRWPLDRMLRWVDVLILNDAEARQATGAEPEAAACDLRASGVGTVIVTLGAAGALVVEGAGLERVPCPEVTAVDSVGAGDVLCGVWAAGTVAGEAALPALRRAVRAASISVTRRGTQSAFPTRAEIAALG